MMTWKRIRIAVWIVLLAIAGLAVVSYLHPFHTRISWSDNRVFAVSIGDGNLRIVHFSAEPDACYMQDSPLEARADYWKGPTNALTWYRFDRTIYMHPPIHVLAVGCSLIAPFAVVLAVLLMCGEKRRRQVAGTIREMISPSDSHTVRPLRRVVHRSVVVILTLATLLALGTWMLTYTWPSKGYTWKFDGRTPSVDSSGNSGKVWLWSTHGRIEMTFDVPMARGTVVPTHDFELGGFRWTQRLLNSTVRTIAVGIPCWAPVLLFSAWPIIAFIRGPYRRAARRTGGFCPRCGYNLTGLVEPRCPECGTPTCCDKDKRRTSVSV